MGRGEEAGVRFVIASKGEVVLVRLAQVDRRM